MSHLFISYSRQDQETVFNLLKDIETVSGEGVCPTDLTPVESDKMPADALADSIDRADIFLFMYSHCSESSERARKEIDYASFKSKRIVLVKLEQRPLSKYYQFQYGGHDIIDITDKSQKEKLLSRIKDWIPAPATAVRISSKTAAGIPDETDSHTGQEGQSGQTAAQTITNNPYIPNNTMYYYLDAARQQQGPVEAQTLRKRGVTENTLVWREGLAAWTRAKDVPELRQIFTTPPPPSEQTPPPPDCQTPQQTAAPQAGTTTTTTANGGQPPKPDNYLVWSILTTLCCCVPAGIYAIICSNKVDTLYKNGDYEGARHAAEDAKKWAIISAIVGGIVSIIYGICAALGQLS